MIGHRRTREEKIDAAMNQRNPKKVDYGGFAWE